MTPEAEALYRIAQSLVSILAELRTLNAALAKKEPPAAPKKLTKKREEKHEYPR
jgi:hypothetical protein